MKDWPSIQRMNAHREQRQFLEDEVLSLDQFKAGSNRKQWPPGSIWYWSLQAVYGPIGSARSAAE